LEQEQGRRKRTLEQLSKQIAGQRQSIARLERDEQRLGTLIDRISKVLTEQSRREAERARQMAEREAKAKAATRGATAPKVPEPERTAARTPSDLPSSASNFGQQKGKLRLPVDGAVSARFGSPRRGDGGSTGPSWKGVFLRAPAGADVKAVGDGQIVFADWLRGFGNLLVIDHGEGYLSIYGSNEALLRNVGDRVAVGEVVASVGNTGGNEAPGLYFELRFQGRPFDPLTWVAAR
jgi:septal ring factor EnvC (AmiA/AmiB activator)